MADELGRKSATRLASRFRTLRPVAGFDNAGRRLWADMVNGVTPFIAEGQVREFREMCGWETEIDRPQL
jgi:hypothetical protein